MSNEADNMRIANEYSNELNSLFQELNGLKISLLGDQDSLNSFNGKSVITQTQQIDQLYSNKINSIEGLIVNMPDFIREYIKIVNIDDYRKEEINERIDELEIILLSAIIQNNESVARDYIQANLRRVYSNKETADRLGQGFYVNEKEKIARENNDFLKQAKALYHFQKEIITENESN